MPYGLPKRLGGDTPAADAKVERCVQQVMAKQGCSKVTAIKICKYAIDRAGKGS